MLNLTILLLTVPVFAETKLYYYFPDSPVSNLSQLKSEVDATFAQSPQKVVFQPFSRLSDFQKQLKNDEQSVIMTPQWVLPKNQDPKIYLNAYRNTQPTYTKFLITARGNHAKQLNPQGKMLATTPMNKSLTEIDQLLDNNSLRFENSLLIEVSKDVDVLFAVALKQVAYGLVAETSLEKIKQINPRLLDTIEVVAETKALALPSVLQIIGNIPEKELNELVVFLKNVHKNNKNAFKTLLQIDEWREAK